MTARELLFGRPLASHEEGVETIGPLTGVAVLGLDALASVSYGPEAALTVLLPAGPAGVRAMMPIVAAVIVVLFLVFLSYRQTIAAYPDGGSSYTVGKQNLGTTAALLAAGALALDYVLNVAVAISAGVGALVSAAPALQPHTLALCVSLLALLTILNLRGIRSTGLVFTGPTYLFVAALATVMIVGAVKAIAAGGSPAPSSPMPAPGNAAAGLGLWLVLRGFASGCTAMTGVEAVSNAVPIFRAPAVRPAQKTLTLIVLILAGLMAGEAVLCRAYHIGATVPGSSGYESVLSQLTRAVAGRGWFYFLAMGAVFAVLCFSANTSFAAFPRLCRLLAEDQFLPSTFGHRGRRLVYAPGIIFLTVVAALLLVAFGGVTDRLIPLFAIGAFLAFTLSQLGMVAHWRRSGGAGAKRAMATNAIGAAATGVTLVVIAISKLTEGAWISLLLIAAIVLGLRLMNRHYRRVDQQMRDVAPLTFDQLASPIVVVPLRQLDRASREALALALGLSSEVQAVQFLTDAPGEQDDLDARWSPIVDAPARAAHAPVPQLVVIRSKYRNLLRPLLEHVRRLAALHPDRYIAVIIPEVVERRWYGQILHRHRAALLKTGLLRWGGARVAIVDVPWHLE
jgi:amino acid transporter